MKRRGIIFDMDGTLWDSAEGVASSWSQAATAELGRQIVFTVEDIHGIMGKTMDVIAKLLFPDIEETARKELFDRCCQEENEYLRRHGGILYPKLKETMLELKKSYPLYIVSNCQTGYIEAFLDHYGLWELFEDIECNGNNGLKKGANIKKVMERNALDEAVYVGDIQGDYDASMEAGAGFIHAAYGFGQINTDVPRIESLQELPAVIKTIWK